MLSSFDLLILGTALLPNFTIFDGQSPVNPFFGVKCEGWSAVSFFDATGDGILLFEGSDSRRYRRCFCIC